MLLRLLKLGSVVSGVLCLAAVALWVRSRGTADILMWGESRYDDGARRLVQRRGTAYSAYGVVGVWWERTAWDVEPRYTAILEKYFREGWRHDTVDEPLRLRHMLTPSGFRYEPDD